MLKRPIAAITVICTFLISCSDTEPRKDNIIAIGPYKFEFPHGYKLKEETGIDSYVGIVADDSIQLGFDYGFYSSSLIMTPSEYLSSNQPEILASYRFLIEGVSYDNRNMPNPQLVATRKLGESDSLFFKGADYMGTFTYQEKEFEQAIYLPEEIEKHSFKVDTVYNHIIKIVVAKNPGDGITGIYIKDLNNYSKSIGAHPALSMATSGLTKQQQDLVLNIFKSIQLGNKD